jgi:hypothetical protein
LFLSDIIINYKLGFVNTYFQKTGKNFPQIQRLFLLEKSHMPAAPKFRPHRGRARGQKLILPFKRYLATKIMQRAFAAIILLHAIL